MVIRIAFFYRPNILIAVEEKEMQRFFLFFIIIFFSSSTTCFIIHLLLSAPFMTFPITHKDKMELMDLSEEISKSKMIGRQPVKDENRMQRNRQRSIGCGVCTALCMEFCVCVCLCEVNRLIECTFENELFCEKRKILIGGIFFTVIFLLFFSLSLYETSFFFHSFIYLPNTLIVWTFIWYLHWIRCQLLHYLNHSYYYYYLHWFGESWPNDCAISSTHWTWCHFFVVVVVIAFQIPLTNDLGFSLFFLPNLNATTRQYI